MRLNKEIDKARLLPMDRSASWVIERRAIEVQIEELGDEVKPEALICADPKEELVIGSNIISPDVSDSEVTSWAVNCMLSPMAGEPRRPASVTLIGGKLKHLRDTFEQLGVEVISRSLPHPFMDEMISIMEQTLLEPGMPPYTIGGNADPEIVADFFKAAADFYRLKPWKLFEFEVPIKIELSGEKQVDYWAVVMGVLGENFGINLFRSFDDLMDLLDCDSDEESFEVAKTMWSFGFSYEEIYNIGPIASAERLSYDWVLAGESAYPAAIVMDPDNEIPVRRPNQDELVDLTAITHALADFFKTHGKKIKKQEGVIEHQILTTSAGKPVSISITLPAPEYSDEEEDEEDFDLPYELINKPETPLDRAQDMVYEAQQEDGKSKRVKLAKQAIIISADCADAYLILAEDAARDEKEQMKYLQDAVDAGRRAIGEEDFKELEGNFWQALETRPYMRARLRLAEFQLKRGELEQAIKDYQDMLRLNTSDNLGSRYPLAMCFLLAGQDDELQKLLKEYKEDITAFWLYTKALLSYRKSGESKKANQEIAKAIAQNKSVVDYLLERKRLPEYSPEHYGFGDENEAILYTELFLEPWKSTEGAIEWLKKSAAASSQGKTTAGKASSRQKSGGKSKQGVLPMNDDFGDDDTELYEKFIDEHPEFADVMDHDEVLINGEPVSPRLHWLIHHVVENQLAHNDPPEAPEALRRLMNGGMNRHEAVHALAGVAVKFLHGSLKSRKQVEREKYSLALRKLKP
ncbi:MAG: DUF1841 family protein [Armatimonadota bacterium]|nr:DUF1841 family protein [Armatimonadota bacterium]